MTLAADQLDLVCYRTRNLPDPYAMKTYESIGGYQVLRDIIQNKRDLC